MTTGGGGDGLALACSRSCCTVVQDYGVVNVVVNAVVYYLSTSDLFTFYLHRSSANN